ncbi:MAG: hypothetical protein ABI423_10695 [Burkholderiales bacterium]
MNSDDAAALARLLRSARLAHLGTLRQGAPLASMTLVLAASGFDAFHVHVIRSHPQPLGRRAGGGGARMNARYDAELLMTLTR